MTRQGGIRKEITKLFKPYITNRKNGQCQILIPLVELDDFVDGILECEYKLGVVIKDNRDPADCESCPVAVVCGYVTVWPLIEAKP